MKITTVAAAIILHDHKVLIAKRNSKGKLAGKWEFPGGKLNPGETFEECLARELKEELNIRVKVLQYFAENTYTYSYGTVNLIGYYVEWIDGAITLNVHDQAKWVEVDKLIEYDLAPADIPLAQKLKKLEKN